MLQVSCTEYFTVLLTNMDVCKLLWKSCSFIIFTSLVMKQPSSSSEFFSQRLCCCGNHPLWNELLIHTALSAVLMSILTTICLNFLRGNQWNDSCAFHKLRCRCKPFFCLTWGRWGRNKSKQVWTDKRHYWTNYIIQTQSHRVFFFKPNYLCPAFVCIGQMNPC